MYTHSVKSIESACNCLGMTYPAFIRKTTKGYICQWAPQVPFIDVVGKAAATEAVTRLRRECKMRARLSSSGNLIVPHT